MVYFGIFDWKRGSLGAQCELTKAFTAIKDNIAEFFAKTERKECKNTQKLYCSMGVVYFKKSP